jgi:respiratory burst oxidase
MLIMWVTVLCFLLVYFKIIAMAIATGICLHAGNHLACDFPRLIASGPEEYRLLAGFFGEEKPTYRHLMSGVVGVTGIVMVVLMAVSFTLAARPLRRAASTRRLLPPPLGHLAGFNAFWYSHHLLVVVYLLLLVHGWFMFLVSKWHQRTVRDSPPTSSRLAFHFSCVYYFLSSGVVVATKLRSLVGNCGEYLRW